MASGVPWFYDKNDKDLAVGDMLCLTADPNKKGPVLLCAITSLQRGPVCGIPTNQMIVGLRKVAW